MADTDALQLLFHGQMLQELRHKIYTISMIDSLVEQRNLLKLPHIGSIHEVKAKLAAGTRPADGK